MRLPLRLAAARNDPSDLLVRYLEEPVMLFVPARIVQAVILVLTGALLSLLFDVDEAARLRHADPVGVRLRRGLRARACRS